MNFSDEASERPILIVGGGIGGFASALALARQGRRSILLEQAPAFTEVGAGIQMAPNAFKVFEALGVEQAMDRISVFPKSLLMRDAISGEEIMEIPLRDQIKDRFGYPYAVVHRADLLDVLIDACRETGLVDAQTSKKVVDFTDHGLAVEAVTEEGELFSGAALIGCDGLWSVVRARIVNDGAPRRVGHVIFRGVIPMEEVPASLRSESVVLWGGPKCHFAHYPLREGGIFNMGAIFQSERYEEGAKPEDLVPEAQERFAQACPPIQELFKRLDYSRMWVLQDRDPVTTWSRGRVTLLGDAAHPMIHYLAQGATMAMEDAVCLASRITTSADLETAFKAYNEDRRVRTARVQLTARFFGEIYHASGPAREIRREVLGGRPAEKSYDSLSWLFGGMNERVASV